MYFLCISCVLLISFQHFFFCSSISCMLWFKQLCLIIGKKYIFINRSIILILFSTSFNISYNVFYRFIDKGILELIGPFGIVCSIRHLLLAQNKLQTGLLYHYSGYILLCFICLTHILVDNFLI